MKKLIFSSLILLGASLASCGDDLLTETNLKDSNVEIYYSNQAEVETALVGVYNQLYTPGDNAINNEVLMANLASDEMFGGGEPSGDLTAKAVDNFTPYGEDMFKPVWVSSYKGIYRAALVIDKIGEATYSSEDARKQDLGEAHFLRAYFYFRLVKYFGGVPLFRTSADHGNALTTDRASLDDVYGFIAAELKLAIDNLPATKYTGPSANYGKINKWIAEGYLARVFLFYTGYKTNVLKVPTTTLPVDGGVALTKADVVTYIDECVTASGYALDADFRSLWPYSKAGQMGGYKWAADAKWDGDGFSLGTVPNMEKMFVVRHGKATQDGVEIMKVRNILCLYTGIRDLAVDNVPFGPNGWGWCTVSKTAYGAMFSTPASDVRAKGSVIDFTDVGDNDCFV